jgi:hypothetical protein
MLQLFLPRSLTDDPCITNDRAVSPKLRGLPARRLSQKVRQVASVGSALFE